MRARNWLGLVSSLEKTSSALPAIRLAASACRPFVVYADASYERDDPHPCGACYVLFPPRLRRPRVGVAELGEGALPPLPTLPSVLRLPGRAPRRTGRIRARARRTR